MHFLEFWCNHSATSCSDIKDANSCPAIPPYAPWRPRGLFIILCVMRCHHSILATGWSCDSNLINFVFESSYQLSRRIFTSSCMCVCLCVRACVCVCVCVYCSISYFVSYSKRSAISLSIFRLNIFPYFPCQLLSQRDLTVSVKCKVLPTRMYDDIKNYGGYA